MGAFFYCLRAIEKKNILYNFPDNFVCQNTSKDINKLKFNKIEKKYLSLENTYRKNTISFEEFIAMVESTPIDLY